MSQLVISQAHLTILREAADGKWVHVTAVPGRSRDEFERRQSIAKVIELLRPYNELCDAAMLRPLMSTTDMGVTMNTYGLTELGEEALVGLQPGMVVALAAPIRTAAKPNPCPRCGTPAEVSATEDAGRKFTAVGCPNRCVRGWNKVWMLTEDADVDPRAADRLVFAWNTLTQQR